MVGKSVIRKKGKRYATRHRPTKLSPRTRWRAIIRTVINNLGWMVEKLAIRSKDETQVVTQSDKYLLFKDPAERKDEELWSLANRMSAYKTLRKYSIDLRVALLRKARFVAYKKSVEIVRQGMLMNNVYLLVKGTGTATRLEESSDQDVTNMKEGHLCGEYPLLYEKPSMTTIATEGLSEWIVFPKHFFLHYARDELKRQYYEVECAMTKFSFFDKLNFFEMREFSVLAEISRVQMDTVLPLVEGTVSLTYFILEGQCCVLQTVQLSKGCGRYPGYCVHPTDGSPSETFIVRTCMLTRRGVFGLGEEACKWVVITDTDCELMVIPRYMLLKYGKNMVWDRLKDQLNHTYPSIDQIVRSLTKEKRWSRYKHRLAKNLSKNLSGNNVHAVPLLARCTEMNSDEEDQIYEQIKSSKTPDNAFGLDLSASTKKIEPHPNLRELVQYLPKEDRKQ